MSQATVLQSVTNFAQEAEPFTHIENDEAYQGALAVVSNLMEVAKDDPSSPLNWAIEGFVKAIASYESQLTEVKKFEAAAASTPADIAMLRLLMEQHELKGTDFPEIGDKTLISKILNGSRSLTKDHITKLVERFGINP
ncbi:MAG: transcriptional regulator, partial [Gammaproteobacteria bacterium]|nr:transcriptional regulator [Gammaproteobacteria bacterium]